MISLYLPTPKTPVSISKNNKPAVVIYFTLLECKDLYHGYSYGNDSFFQQLENVTSSIMCRDYCFNDSLCILWSWNGAEDKCFLYENIKDPALELSGKFYSGYKICLSIKQSI